jgi:hypothetical protein
MEGVDEKDDLRGGGDRGRVRGMRGVMIWERDEKTRRCREIVTCWED